MLGISERALASYISRSPELKALWSRNGEGGVGVDEILAGREVDGIESADPDQVMQSIIAQDRVILEQGMKKLGLKPETLDKLRDLDGLALNGGKFLSVSIQTMHKSYFMQLMRLWERSMEIETKYLNNENLEPKQRAFWYRMWSDMVKEHGKGYQMMFQGAEALITMLQAAGHLPTPDPAPPVRPPAVGNAKPKKERPSFTVDAD